jgi:hypothetical protein
VDTNDNYSIEYGKTVLKEVEYGLDSFGSGQGPVV